mgnify:CR=1 FL=1
MVTVQEAKCAVKMIVVMSALNQQVILAFFFLNSVKLAGTGVDTKSNPDHRSMVALDDRCVPLALQNA